MAARDRASPLAAAALVLAGCLWLCGCDRLLLAVPCGGWASRRPKSAPWSTAIDDLTIRVALNGILLHEDADLYRAVSFSVVEGRVLLKGSRAGARGDRVRAVKAGGREWPGYAK